MIMATGSGDSNSTVRLPLTFKVSWASAPTNRRRQRSVCCDGNVIYYCCCPERCIVDRFCLCSKFTDVTLKRFLLSRLLDGCCTINRPTTGIAITLIFRCDSIWPLLQLLIQINAQGRTFSSNHNSLASVALFAQQRFSFLATPTGHCKHLHRQNRFNSKTEHPLSSSKVKNQFLHPLPKQSHQRRPETY